MKRKQLEDKAENPTNKKLKKTVNGMRAGKLRTGKWNRFEVRNLSKLFDAFGPD
jgi:hypothetical protein